MTVFCTWIVTLRSWIKHVWECYFIPCECTYKVWHMQGATCSCIGLKIAQFLFKCFKAVCLFTVMHRVGLNEGGMPCLLDVQNFHHSHFWLYVDLLFCIWSKLMAGSLFSGHSSVFLYINSSYCFKMYKAECLCRPEQLQTFDVFASVFHPWCTAVASPFLAPPPLPAPLWHSKPNMACWQN